MDIIMDAERKIVSSALKVFKAICQNLEEQDDELISDFTELILTVFQSPDIKE